ncbi:Hypothetical Protein SLY_0860 [Strawberry lethal yellows phytoplasma (CPA) str. NZSb11]|uniref:Uncharacterized protein n=1 Tax=Strawberry lethal yellows phytoplasma (CPA) str. NZSb11 TaxID=980422 RepID=R4RN42_PHYAS|nr:Hypothetical Protein SLY_0860 [Strawberry lethal yellows phytoplasma (CPA) str. NZSb11]
MIIFQLYKNLSYLKKAKISLFKFSFIYDKFVFL